MVVGKSEISFTSAVYSSPVSLDTHLIVPPTFTLSSSISLIDVFTYIPSAAFTTIAAEPSVGSVPLLYAVVTVPASFAFTVALSTSALASL